MKRLIALIVLVLAAPSVAWAGGIDDPAGLPLYVIIDVTWDGSFTDQDTDGSTDSSSWTVWGPRYAPVVGVGGSVLSTCTDCLDFSGFSVDFRGRTLQFDEVYVSGVNATPQTHHVVLKDPDGDNAYTGSLAAARYEFEGVWALYMDRIDYSVTVDGSGNITNFYYLEYEHKKCLDPSLPDTAIPCPDFAPPGQG